ncbi:DUF6624 domain-containing protein [Brevundimonas sp.]
MLASGLLALALLTGQEATTRSSPLMDLQAARALACDLDDRPCLTQELALRRSADQGVRQDELLNLDCHARHGAAATPEQCQTIWKEVDADNLPRVKAILDRHGWPTGSSDFQEAIWLIVQHAPDADGGTELRERWLPDVRAAYQRDGLSEFDYTAMVDRISMARTGLQIYGTHRPCRDGAFDRTSVQSAEAVEAARAELGMDIRWAELLPFYDQKCAVEASIPG